jgi:hypothetical protein
MPIPLLDPKWLGLLKAGGWKNGAISVTFAVFLFAIHVGRVHPWAPWVVPLSFFVMVLCGSLALTSIITAPAVQDLMGHWFKRRRERQKVLDSIPLMTAEERKIIAYLLAKNQNMFVVEAKRHRAHTLMARGIVVTRLDQHGQMSSMIPLAVPDHIWDVLTENRDKFPYTPPPRHDEGDPWTVSWALPY